MVGILFEFKDLKWIIRICLILLFTGGMVAEFYGHQFFNYLVTDHKTTTLTLIFISAIMFLPWLVPKPKRINQKGGEVPMNKFHTVIVFIIAVLVGLIAYLGFYPNEARTFISGLGGGIGETVVNMFSGFNQSLGSYEPYQVLTGGGIGGMALAMFLASWLWPRIQQRRQIQPLTDPLQREIIPTAPTSVKKVEEPAK